MAGPWSGVRVSSLFRSRWKSGKHVGAAKPAVKMEIRRGHLQRRFHTWQEAGIVGLNGKVAYTHRLWYPDWVVDGDWEEIVGVKNVRLEQSFQNNGVTAATIDIDNLVYAEHGAGLDIYHTIERGWYSPLRGYVYPGRPAVKDIPQDSEYMKLPNAQVRVWFGYGTDAMEVGFVGLIDTVEPNTQGQAIQMTGRDFGGLFVDQQVFGWSKDRQADDPVTFMPKNLHKRVTEVGGGASASSSAPGRDARNVTRRGRHTAWWSDASDTDDIPEWVEIHVPAGRYKGLYFVGDFEGETQDIHIGVFSRPRGNEHDGYSVGHFEPYHGGPHQLLNEDNLDVRWYQTDRGGKRVPVGWVNLAHGNWQMPTGVDAGWSIFRGPVTTEGGKGIHIEFSGTLLLGSDSTFRVGITPKARHDERGRRRYRAGVRSLHAEKVDEIDKNLNGHKTVPIGDVSEIAETVFRWMGFKEWEVETVGTDLKHSYVVDKSKSWMDILNDLQAQTGFVFFMAPPTDNGESSIGRPIFRQSRIVEQKVDHTEQVTDKNLLEEMKLKVDNQSERSMIRTRGKALAPKHGGRRLYDDTIPRAMYSYVPPWARHYKMAGVIKPLTHYDANIETVEQCAAACYLIAIQIALQKYTAIANLPGTPGISLDSFLSVIDRASGANSRIYVTNVTQEFTAGQDAKYTLEVGGGVPDTFDMYWILNDRKRYMAGDDPNDGPHRGRRVRRPHTHQKPPVTPPIVLGQ